MNTSSITAAELEARLLLHTTPHVGPQRYQQLLEFFGSAEQAWRAPVRHWQQLGLPPDAIEARRSDRVRHSAMQALRWLEADGCHLLFRDGADYPALLAETGGAPPLLFVEGNPALLHWPQLALIGSRHASPPGLQLARSFAAALAGSGCCITSGLAAGIDSAAHLGALDAEGATLAVVGTGLLHTYPKRNLGLRRHIIAGGGALVSELAVDAGPHASHFTRRNRIISGLSLGVLVVEAGIGSGSLITARYAAEQGRDVFAIPGSIHYPGSKGCHQLIREGAVLVESVQDVLEQWRHWQLAVPAAPEQAPDAGGSPLLGLLCSQPMNAEQLAEHLQMDIAEVLTALSLLEIEGRIRQQAGCWFFMA